MAMESSQIREQSSSLDHLLLSLGKKIKSLRLERGMSQSCLSRNADIDRTYLSCIENGKKNLSILLTLRIAKALDVDIRQLISQ
jgi:transcriptional regulator with XRE-family HTH domain